MICIFQDVSHTALVSMDQRESCFQNTELVFRMMKSQLQKPYVTLLAILLELLGNGTSVGLLITFNICCAFIYV